MLDMMRGLLRWPRLYPSYESLAQDVRFGLRLQIVGVAERGFTGVEPGIMTDVWIPTMMWDERAFTQPGWSWFRIWGRLQPGISP